MKPRDLLDIFVDNYELFLAVAFLAATIVLWNYPTTAMGENLVIAIAWGLLWDHKRQARAWRKREAELLRRLVERS